MIQRCFQQAIVERAVVDLYAAAMQVNDTGGCIANKITGIVKKDLLVADVVTIG
jgi:hypothetical protein